MEKSIVVTGAAGFIGSVLVKLLNKKGLRNVILVDDFSREDKRPNWQTAEYAALIAREEFPEWLQAYGERVAVVFHLGARTDTTEFDVQLFDRLNLNYSKSVWKACTKHGIPLIYASSAATYGMGEHGYADSHEVIPSLQPLNPYGWSKQQFDLWVLDQEGAPPFWAGIKFFNVYGPNEYHKGRMASVVWHAFRQIRDTGYVKLFRSHHPDYKDGEQLRDFIYVLDAVEVIYWLWQQQPASGLYNLGTGQAASFNTLANSVFKALQMTPDIRYIDTPADIRDTYQYFTEADMTKLRQAGCALPMRHLAAGVADYVQHYLQPSQYR